MGSGRRWRGRIGCVTDYVPDWTCDERGASNSSEEFDRLVDEVARLIHANGGSCLSPTWVRATAGLIMAQLAHRHHIGPLPPA